MQFALSLLFPETSTSRSLTLKGTDFLNNFWYRNICIAKCIFNHCWLQEVDCLSHFAPSPNSRDWYFWLWTCFSWKKIHFSSLKLVCSHLYVFVLELELVCVALSECYLKTLAKNSCSVAMLPLFLNLIRQAKSKNRHSPVASSIKLSSPEPP